MTAITQGYQLFPAVFDAEFMAAAQRMIKTDPVHCLADFMHHERVIEIAQSLTGSEALRPTEEESACISLPAVQYSKWHFDAPWEPKHESGIFPIWRFGIYFQDMTLHSGGLGVVPGSHLGQCRKPDGDQFPWTYVGTQPGDLVVWNVRLYHRDDSPNGDLPKPRARDAMFFDLGAPGFDIDSYIFWRRQAAAARRGHAA